MLSIVTACLAFLLVALGMAMSDGIRGRSAELSAVIAGRGVLGIRGEEEKNKKKNKERNQS
jgi:hypothetical protein